MRTESKNFLRELLDAPSPSGFEGPAASVVKEYVKNFADEVRVDVHGNLMASIGPENAHPRVMFAGHMDEIGLMVTCVDEKGFIGFRPIGGWDARQLNGQRVLIHTASGPLRGVIGGRAIHLLDQDERNKVTKLEDLWIDIGHSGREKVQDLVAVGDPVTVGADYEEFGENLAISRCFDDKMGTWLAMEALRELAERKADLKARVTAVATVQEEIGLRGGQTSAYSVHPDVGIAIDVTHAMDAPNGGRTRDVGDIRIASGPVISRGPNINHRVFEGLKRIAEEKEIPIQIEAAPKSTGTDANPMQLSRGGVAVGLLSIPLRYMHTTVEVLSLEDLEKGARLLAEYALTLGPESEFLPY